MPTITTEIDIAASPSDVRKVVSHESRRKLASTNLRCRCRLRHSILTRMKFLDFASYPEWSRAFIKSIQVTAGDETNIKPGDTLKVDLGQMKFAPVVQVCRALLPFKSRAGRHPTSLDSREPVSNERFPRSTRRKSLGGAAVSLASLSERILSALHHPHKRPVTRPSRSKRSSPVFCHFSSVRPGLLASRPRTGSRPLTVTCRSAQNRSSLDVGL